MSETVEVRRDGSYLTISADLVDRYIARGFDVVDENDNIIVKSIPNDVSALKNLCIKQEAEINALKARINELESAKKVNVKVEPVTPVVELDNADTVEDIAPVKVSKRRKKAE